MRDSLEFGGCFLMFIVVVLVIVILPGAIIANHCTFVNDSAEIEQLRSDVPLADVLSSEDVMGQATEWNQKIAAWRRWNQAWGICLLVPNGWDEIEYIAIPQGE